MIRVLHIARYRTPSMEKKVTFMAAERDLRFFIVRPGRYEDLFGRHTMDRNGAASLHRKTVALLGKPDDPHRALYRTGTFGMGRAAPQIIHAEEEPDSLAAFQIAAARRLFAPRARLVLHTYQNVNRPKSPQVRLVLGVTLNQASAVLCANRGAVGVLRQMGYRGPAPVVLPEGVDTEIFKPSPTGRRSGPFAVLYAGRFVEEKGVTLLLEAVSDLRRDARVLLVGAGPYRGVIEQRARRLGLASKVSFDPPRQPSEMPEVFARADVLVLPSVTTPVWKEQFGRVLVEAMACRIPVIGSSSGAIPDVIGDGGLVFDEGDRVGLTDALQRLIDSPSLRRELAERGFQRVRESFTQQCVAEATVRAYRDILS